MTIKKKPLETSLSGTRVPERAPVPAGPAATALPMVDLDTFCTVAGVKWDQMAGFRAHARAANFQNQTVPEWRNAYEAFMHRPCV